MKCNDRSLSFFCLGAQKAGTTSLYDMLTQHPEVCLSSQKETMFFRDDDKYARGLEWYFDTYFSHCEASKMCGEINPEYMYFDFIPKRIHDVVGKDVKLIFILRNPVERAFSQYLMNVRRGFEKLDFQEALAKEPERMLKNDLHAKHKSFQIHGNYVGRGRYAEQIKRFLKYFPVENIMCVVFETEFVAKKEETLQALMSFIGLNLNVVIDFSKKSNVARSVRYSFINDVIRGDTLIKHIGKFFIPGSLWRKTKKRLISWNEQECTQRLDEHVRKEVLSYFMDDIAELECLINKDLSVWYDEGKSDDR